MADQFIQKPGDEKSTTTLAKAGVKEDSLEELAKKTIIFGDIGTFKKLGQKDILKILERAY